MLKSSILMTIVLSLLSLLSLLSPLPPDPGILAPAPPEIAVNHATRQCANVTRGDECVYCEPPEGWEILGREGQVECPQGYQMVDLQMVCKGSRELRCCLPGHSGGQGDCAGVALDFVLCCAPVLLLLAGLVFLISRFIRRRRRRPV